MKRVLNITIGNIVFYIEEDAYDKLSQYLASIKEYFAFLADPDEMLRDIETRIAEHFQDQRIANRAITIADVEHLIIVMGAVTDFDTESETERTSNDQQRMGLKKRLLRNPDDKVLFGVAGGLGAFFDVDPIIFRILFVVTTIFGGWGLLVYLILWLTVPEATTQTDKMEMRGKAITVSALKEELKQVAVSHKEDTARITKLARKFFNMLAEILTFIFKRLLPLLGKIVAGVLVVVFSIALVALTFILANIIFNTGAPYIDLPVAEIVGKSTYYILMSSLYITIAIPLVFLLTLAFSAIRKEFLMNKIVGLGLLALWVVAFSTAGATAIHSAPLMKSAIENHPAYVEITREYDIKDFSAITVSDRIRAQVSEGTEFQVSATGPEEILDTLDMSVQNGQLIATRTNHSDRVCFICLLPQKEITLNITVPKLTQITAHDISRVIATNLSDENINIVAEDLSRIDVVFSQVKQVSLTTTGAARITAAGTATTMTINTQDVSQIYAEDVQVQDATITTKDASRVEISPLNTLKIVAHDISRVLYNGNPEINQTVTDAARVIQNQVE